MFFVVEALSSSLAPQWRGSITYNCFVVFGVAFALFYFVLFTPLYQSYYPPTARPKRKRSSNSHLKAPVSGGLGLDTLQQVLESGPGRRAFEQHLMLEFSIESLLFVCAFV